MDALSFVLLAIVIAVVVIVIVSVRRRSARALDPSYVPIADTAPYNTLAIVAFVTSFVVSIVGIVCGHLALGDIRRRRERGRGLAIAALWIGYLTLAASLAAAIVAVVLAFRR